MNTICNVYALLVKWFELCVCVHKQIHIIWVCVVYVVRLNKYENQMTIQQLLMDCRPWMKTRTTTIVDEDNGDNNDNDVGMSYKNETNT